MARSSSPAPTSAWGSTASSGWCLSPAISVSGLISSYLIWEARQLGASRWVIGRMMANTLIDTTIGAIPVLGDAFDVVFRNNLRNMALLRKHLARKGMTDPGAGPIIEGEAIRLS